MSERGASGERRATVPRLWRLVRRLGTCAALLASGVAAAAEDAVAFDDLLPLLQERCLMCHSGPGAPLGLDLSTHEAVMAGSARGPVVVLQDPDASELVRRLRGESLPRMPLTGPPYLSDEEIALFARWIEGGAPAGGPTGADDGAARDREAAAGDAGAAAPAEPREAAPAAPPPDGTGPVTYADVQPLLLARCATCHTAAGLLGPPPEGYRLDTYEETVRADDRARVVPGAPAASELVRRVIGQAEPRMPLGGPYLGESEIDLLVRWIADGARDASGTQAPLPVGADVRLHGTWLGSGLLDDLEVAVDASTRFDDDVRAGDRVQLRGVLEADGRVRAERIRRE